MRAQRQAPRFCARFSPKTQAQQLAAIGLNSDGHGKILPKRLCRCFDPSGGEWEDIDTPRPHEWLEDMLDRTPDQSFDDFVKSRPNVPSRSRNVIYLQPLCDPQELLQPAFPDGPWPSWSILEAAVQRFYSPLEVRTLDAIPMNRLRPTPAHREDRGYGTQWHAGKVLDSLQRDRLPTDAFCMLAVTMCDLYPRDEWNFVYGLAKLTARVGVFSFIRHTPEADEGTAPWREATMLHSSMKTMLHEIGHMFGMKHCTWFNCLMRGNNGAMVEHQPNYLHLCPVCLHKLQWSTRLDVPLQYSQLLGLFEAYEDRCEEFKKDCAFLRARLVVLDDLQSRDAAKNTSTQNCRAASLSNVGHVPPKAGNVAPKTGTALTRQVSRRSPRAASLPKNQSNVSEKNRSNVAVDTRARKPATEVSAASGGERLRPRSKPPA